ncbi:unnamed protein product [Hymenolepis diminuta]|uniref:Uncharacterized protein n=1 Tax=Hymenolepis diminuta TaxID=6216 RepID=A0A3P6ZFJ5_HYMDI|nr:unnamed protein product [Hymenolepis diminuta]
MTRPIVLTVPMVNPVQRERWVNLAKMAFQEKMEDGVQKVPEAQWVQLALLVSKAKMVKRIFFFPFEKFGSK